MCVIKGGTSTCLHLTEESHSREDILECFGWKSGNRSTQIVVRQVPESESDFMRENALSFKV